jgi:hypothetical protein
VSDLSVVKRWPSREALGWAERFVSQACLDPNLDAFVAIGSAVRDATHASSDVDFTLIYHDLKPDLLCPPIEVDVRPFRRDAVEDDLARGHDVLGSAVQFGRLVCEHEGYWTRLRARWQGRVPLPSVDAAHERERRARAQARTLILHGDTDAAKEMVLSLLTHRARARLAASGVYPASKPELPAQLRSMGDAALAVELESALRGTWSNWRELETDPFLDIANARPR